MAALVLVTGASGMLGSHICRKLVHDGYKVRVLLHSNLHPSGLEGLPVENVQGSILDADSLDKAVEGCDFVIHSAASTTIWPARSKITRDINIKAVHMLVQAVQNHSVTRLVHIGTANSFGPGTKINPGTEGNTYTDHKYSLDYQDSKYEAQKYLLEQYAEKKLPVVIVNPTFMFGAYDSKPGAGQMIVALYKGKTPGYTSGGKNFVPAQDVAAAVVNALVMGNTGQCYLAAGVNLSYKEAFQLISTVIGVKAPKLYIPGFLADIFGLLGSIAGKILKKEPVLSLPMARLSHKGCYYTNKKAGMELHMPQTSLEQAIRECFLWLKEHEYID